MVRLVSPVLLAVAAVTAVVSAGSPPPSAHNLPIFFFHGINGKGSDGDWFKANLSTDARPFVELTSCEAFCTLNDINVQADKAIAEIRSVVTNDTRFQNGYVFLAHSLGGAVARAVIQTMDDHKVHTFFSLAGALNGLAYGPQASDLAAAQTFLKYYAPVFYSSELFSASKYTVADIQSGKLTVDLATLLQYHPELQVTSGVQFARSPIEKEWIKYNTFYPPLNNLQPPTTDTIKTEQARRKKNFLKLTAMHLFASSYDETISPWQSAQLGEYSTFETLDEFAANFQKWKVLEMPDTIEYIQDTYGLQTLDKRGGVFRHTFDKVPHTTWIRDTVSVRDNVTYHFLPVYEKGLYPLIATDTTAMPAPTTTKPKPAC